MIRYLLAAGLVAVGAIAIVLPLQLFGGEDEKFLRDLREMKGEVLERYPNGVHKITRAAIVLGNPGSERIIEVRTEQGEAPNVKKRVFKSPSREFSETWDTGKGWVQDEVVRDDRTLARRWGISVAPWILFVAGSVFIGAGVALAAMTLRQRK